MLTLEIDGNWEPEDFIEVLKSIESLYYKAALKTYGSLHHLDYRIERPYGLEQAYRYSSFKDHLDYLNDWILNESRMNAQGHLRLKVARIQYASPGGIDFIGLGEACKAIEGVLDRLIKFYTERNMRKEQDKQRTIETEIKRVELEKEKESLQALKIENAHRFLDLIERHPDREEMLIPLLVRDQDKVATRISSCFLDSFFLIASSK